MPTKEKTDGTNSDEYYEEKDKKRLISDHYSWSSDDSAFNLSKQIGSSDDDSSVFESYEEYSLEDDEEEKQIGKSSKDVLNEKEEQKEEQYKDNPDQEKMKMYLRSL